MATAAHSYAPPPSFLRCYLRGLYSVLFLAGLLAVGYVGFTLVQTHVYQAKQSEQLATAAKVEPVAKPAATPKLPPVEPAKGAVMGKVTIPRIRLEAVVVQGDSESILKLAVGHIPGTALPGENGNLVLAGHRDSFFRPLRHIKIGDHIVFEGPGGTQDYQVESTRIVPPTDVSVLRPAHTKDKELTLITCYPFTWIGSAPNRFIVHAR